MKRNTNSRFYLFLLSFFMLSWHIAVAQDIAINEIMASNSNTIDDEDGDHPDWIEFYNSRNTPVDLEGFGITDDPTELYK